jgi:hypothetical protein
VEYSSSRYVEFLLLPLRPPFSSSAEGSSKVRLTEVVDLFA